MKTLNWYTIGRKTNVLCEAPAYKPNAYIGWPWAKWFHHAKLQANIWEEPVEIYIGYSFEDKRLIKVVGVQ